MKSWSNLVEKIEDEEERSIWVDPAGLQASHGGSSGLIRPLVVVKFCCSFFREKEWRS